MRLDWFSSTVKVPYNQFPESYCRQLPFFPDATILFSVVQKKNSINVQKTVYLTLFLQPAEEKQWVLLYLKLDFMISWKRTKTKSTGVAVKNPEELSFVITKVLFSHTLLSLLKKRKK